MLDHRLTTGALNMASIRKRGNSWQARVKRLGTEVEQSFKSRQAAERWARQIEVKIELGEYETPTPSPEPDLTETNFKDVLAKYSKEVACHHRSPTSKINIQILIKDLGHLTLREIEPRSIAAWRNSKLQKIKPASVNRLIGTLGSVINHARKEWQLPIDNPILNIKRPSSGQARTRRFVGDEEQRLLAALTPKYAQVAQFAIATAMRRGEILGLCWEHIDLIKRTALLAVTKNGEPRCVPLTSAAIAVLMELSNLEAAPPTGLVFNVHPVALDKAWRRACKASGIEGLHVHDLRHEAISRFFELGLNVMEVSAISGHKTLSQLKRYSHLHVEHLLTRLDATRSVAKVQHPNPLLSLGF